MRKMSTRTVGAALALALAALVTVAPAQAQEPASLSGETFQAHYHFLNDDNLPVGDLQINGPCNPTGPSTFTFTATGVTTGPYPGTFHESGTFTQSAPAVGGGRVITAYDATFTIESDAGQVSGSKSLRGQNLVPGGSCTENDFLRIVDGSVDPLTYDAHITTTTGSTTDHGTSGVGLHKEQDCTSCTPVAFENFNFSEYFVSTGPAPPGPATVTVTPAAATNNIGDQHCVTATVRDAAGEPLPGVSVIFEVSGANPQPPHATTTDQNGEAQFCYTGLTPGEDVIRAFADSNGNGSQDPGEPAGVASKTYVIPPSTAGCFVDTAGWFVATDGDQASFGGNAQAESAAVAKGEQEYQDHGPASDLNFHSTKTGSLVCSGNRAQIYGVGTVDNIHPVSYRIDLTDAGEPGTSDTYRIRLNNGYDSGEHQLLGGNIQVRP
jgi:Bacterial Ig-like domain (group 1)